MSFEVGETKKGWGVFRSSPWHFVAIFPTKQEAETKAEGLGAGYEVKFGEHRVGTSDFVYSELEN